MATKYLTRFSLNWQHSFYSSGVLRGVRVLPLPSTSLQLGNYRIILKQRPEGFALLQESRQLNEVTQPVVAIEKSFPLVFGFYTGDPDFQVKTAISFYSNNRQKLVADLRGTADQSAEGPELRLLDLRKSDFPFKAESGLQARVLNTAGETQAEFNRKDSSEDFIIRTAGLTDDVYRIRTDDSEYEFLLLTNDQKFDGVILLNSTQTFNNIGLKFNSRKILVEHIVSQKYDQYKDLNMVEENGSVIFEKAAHPSINNAFVFTSNTEIELKEKQEQLFFLEDRERIVKKNIGFPSLKNVGMCLINVHNFCLKNYVSV